MNKILNILSSLLSSLAHGKSFVAWYRERYFPSFFYKEDFSDCVSQDEQEVNDYIYNMLAKDEPCMISRFGSNELGCTLCFMKGRHPFWFLRKIYPFWEPKLYVKEVMRTGAGFFSQGNEAFCKFAEKEMEWAQDVDLLGTWVGNEVLLEPWMHYKKCNLEHLVPFFVERPWSRILKGKKVLVIHPFAETIKSQYERRELLFNNPDVLPEFGQLIAYKSLQSIGGETCGFTDWFDALKFMEDEIDKIDYDIALIGCGAYGMPVAAHCKKMGKKAVHLGGTLQLLFGIKGKRWVEGYKGRYPLLCSNPNWVYPSKDETPAAAKKVENGCYW